MAASGRLLSRLGANLDQLGVNLGSTWSLLEPTCRQLGQTWANLEPYGHELNFRKPKKSLIFIGFSSIFAFSAFMQY